MYVSLSGLYCANYAIFRYASIIRLHDFGKDEVDCGINIRR